MFARFVYPQTVHSTRCAPTAKETSATDNAEIAEYKNAECGIDRNRPWAYVRPGLFYGPELVEFWEKSVPDFPQKTRVFRLSLIIDQVGFASRLRQKLRIAENSAYFGEKPKAFFQNSTNSRKA